MEPCNPMRIKARATFKRDGKSPRKLPLAFPFLFAVLLTVGVFTASAIAEQCTDSCISCHGNPADVHGDFDHGAVPGNGPVVIFDDDGHDDAGHIGNKPYFDVTVDCGLCHYTDLTSVHGNDCATCHFGDPSVYDSLGLWGKGCQQGGCHVSYHDNSTKAHVPFEDTSGRTPNNCSLCHQSWGVTQSECLNCHAATGPGDVIPPVTTSDTRDEYVGPARIGFSITDNGKVGVGRTFYMLNGGPVTAAGKTLLITAPRQHTLEFWSTDQYGNAEEAHNHVAFTVNADSIPPTTTADALPNYNQGGVITLTATDNSTLGVKTTYYRLNNGPTQAGTKIVLPNTAGAIEYTLAYWSEDWAGNVESEKSVTFTVTSGTGTLRLVWGASDMYGTPCDDDPEANAAWIIRKGSWSGPVVASSYGGCPNWSGVTDIAVPAGTTPYYVSVDWWDSYWGVDEQTRFANVSVTTPGQIVRLGY